MTEWLDEEEMAAWLPLIRIVQALPQALDKRLREEAGIPHNYYGMLATLSARPDRTLTMGEPGPAHRLQPVPAQPRRHRPGAARLGAAQAVPRGQAPPVRDPHRRRPRVCWTGSRRATSRTCGGWSSPSLSPEQVRQPGRDRGGDRRARRDSARLEAGCRNPRLPGDSCGYWPLQRSGTVGERQEPPSAPRRRQANDQTSRLGRHRRRHVVRRPAGQQEGVPRRQRLGERGAQQRTGGHEGVHPRRGGQRQGLPGLQPGDREGRTGNTDRQRRALAGDPDQAGALGRGSRPVGRCGVRVVRREPDLHEAGDAVAGDLAVPHPRAGAQHRALARAEAPPPRPSRRCAPACR
ncbi:hypothetical protein [Nocardioides convexus]|uniref:hypothetical protein n=1 Tax=Nocardioides convexus TaxID=2712224 RepID=UPI0024183122|nr:hypothetical protein [Nocardioides convexus]